MSSNSLSEIREKFILAALAKLQGADMTGDPATADLLLNGALLKTLDTVGNDAPELMSDLESYDANPHYVGVAYNRATDTFERLGAAQGEAVGSLFNMNLSPVFSKLRRVVLTDAGDVYKGISLADKTKHDDGSDVALDGSNGQIMVEYQPAWYRTGVWGDWVYVMLSHLPLPGFSLFPLFDGMDAVYRGAYEASVYDDGSGDKLYSIAKSPADGTSDVYPVTTRSGDWGHSSLTTQATDALAIARGTGWQQEDLLAAMWERFLMVVGYASFDIPGIVGDGRINITVGDWVNGERIGKCGLGDASAGYASAVQNGGSAGYDTDHSMVFLIENPWGNVWKRVASLVNSGALYYKPQPPYDYGSTSGWTRLQDALGTDITLPQASGWAGTPHSGLGMVLPSDVTGSSSTKMHDYYYYSSGLRVLRVGGHADSGSLAGPFSWSAYGAASNTVAHVGGRLCYKKAAV